MKYMRSILVFIALCFVAGCTSGTMGVSRRDHLFSIGTYQKGSNITEPRPRETKYLRTEVGGFEIIQGFAAFKLYIDVIRKPERRLYTRAIIPNPSDQGSPFVYEHYLDPSTPSTSLTHGPAMGLQIHKDYTVKFILYSDEARTKEVDRLSQKIHCYVDTTGHTLKLYGRMKPKNIE